MKMVMAEATDSACNCMQDGYNFLCTSWQLITVKCLHDELTGKHTCMHNELPAASANNMLTEAGL